MAQTERCQGRPIYAMLLGAANRTSFHMPDHKRKVPFAQQDVYALDTTGLRGRSCWWVAPPVASASLPGRGQGRVHSKNKIVKCYALA